MPAQHAWLRHLVQAAEVRQLADTVRAPATSGSEHTTVTPGHAAKPLGPDQPATATPTATSMRAVAQGSRGSSGALTAGAIAHHTGQPVLLVVAHLDEADDAVDDLELFEAAGMTMRVRRFGALEVLPGESNVSLDLVAERLDVVEALHRGDAIDVIVAPVQALMQSVPPPQDVEKLAVTLQRGLDFGPQKLATWLQQAGYERVDAIEQPGEFAVRGGIVDVFPPPAGAQSGPIRLDYFGDEIDTIHTVDPDTLGSGEEVPSARILGATEAVLRDDEQTISLLQLLPEQTIAVMHEVMELQEQARGYYERLTDARGVYPPRSVFARLVERPGIELNQYSNTSRRDDTRIDLPVEALPAFPTDAREAIVELGELAQKQGQNVTVVCDKTAERDRLIELLREHAPESVTRVQMEHGYLHRGFVWHRHESASSQGPVASEEESSLPPDQSGLATGLPATGPLTIIPHHELFHRYQTRRRVRQLTAKAGSHQAGDAFLDLDVGEYVVHVEHGIAKFVGLRAMRKQSNTKSIKKKPEPGPPEEYLTLEFANKAKLHVPATQIDLIQKYVGGFEGKPPLSTLGGNRWKKQKEQVAEAVKDLAAELLRVQAARESTPGIRYPADTRWQNAFEAEFPYDETEDQLAAIARIKQDMSADKPMDRLICGDVGFGKTEVAIRAAFKAAEFGRQVAVLVPTTVLAEQHERTFRARMADYPFNIASLSRFKTAKEQKNVLKKLTGGEVDIVIGTHRLLSKDVKFADLGLVIVDEEQRFGVEHKSKLLAFRLTADVLTLTATPIPRTLHMSMIGLRDISSLSTAPVDRRAIVTEVIPYDERRIKQAIVRELNRDGQVYFVHNRVHNIRTVADDIQRLVPDARIVIGHGQMSPHDLSEVMTTFIRGEADILVATTIIESGIDIPTANTMFINQADHYGLADLHQLRGRVGRYKHRAYCYLLLPPERTVGEVAAKRLKAIEQYSMLGAGFKIAMRDLEIRGAGNLLGAEQSGHIAAVGYEMYCHLLERATKTLNREPIVEPTGTHLELPVHGTIPRKYVKSNKHRMDLYRRFSRASTMAELDTVERDLRDAYGDPPAEVQVLIDLFELRLALSTHGVETLKLDGPDLIFTTHRPRKIEELIDGAPGRVSVLDDETLYYRPPEQYLSPTSTLIAVLRKLFVRPLREAAQDGASETGE